MVESASLGIRQFVEAWRILCAAAPGFAAESCPGIEHISSGVPIAFFNASIVTAAGVSAGELRSLARSACDWAASRGVAWLFVTTQETLGPGVDAAHEVECCGLAPLMSLTGMVARDVAPAPVPAGLELQPAATDAACASVLDVNAAAYEMSLTAAMSVWGRAAFWSRHSLSLGLVEGRAVSSAATILVDGYRYVALVATVPGERRRGYADAVMRHSLAAAGRTYGDCPTFLHATDAGRPVYERMGYQAVSTHQIFIEKRFIESH